MFLKILEITTGKDDLERVALKNDLSLLNAYLAKRPVWIPQKPRRFLDAGSMSQEELLELIQKESQNLAGETVDLWILELGGKKRLPVFSSQKKMETFSAKMSTKLNKVFGLGCIEALLPDVIRQLDVDFIDINLFSEKSWEICVGKQK